MPFGSQSIDTQDIQRGAIILGADDQYLGAVKSIARFKDRRTSRHFVQLHDALEISEPLAEAAIKPMARPDHFRVLLTRYAGSLRREAYDEAVIADRIAGLIDAHQDLAKRKTKKLTDMTRAWSISEIVGKLTQVSATLLSLMLVGSYLAQVIAQPAWMPSVFQAHAASILLVSGLVTGIIAIFSMSIFRHLNDSNQLAHTFAVRDWEKTWTIDYSVEHVMQQSYLLAPLPTAAQARPAFQQLHKTLFDLEAHRQNNPEAPMPSAPLELSIAQAEPCAPPQIDSVWV